MKEKAMNQTYNDLLVSAKQPGVVQTHPESSGSGWIVVQELC
jgi:hypothetical protein